MRSILTAFVLGATAVASTASATSATSATSSPPTVLGYAAAFASCSPQGGGDLTFIPVSVPTGGPAYSTSTPGVITSFSYVEKPIFSAETLVRALVVRPSGPGYLIVGRTAQQKPVAGPMTFPARLPMQPGDVLALNVNTPEGIGTACHSRADGTSAVSVSDVGVNSSLVVSASTYSGLPDISAVLEPDADGDGYGDLTQDLCPAAASVQSACPVPDTQLDKLVRKRTHRHAVTVSFVATVPGSTFLCRLDGLAAKPCQSPDKVRAGRGKHQLLVQAVFAGQGDPTPLVVKWRVVPRH